MTVAGWLPTPVGLDAPRWVTRAGCRTALVVVHTLVSGQRLLDVVDLVESDPRVQVVFTVAPDAFNHVVPHYLTELDALILPWEQAVRERFDLVLAASYGGLGDLHGPVVVLPHGARYGKRLRRLTDDGCTVGEGPVYGLDAQRLTRDGTVLAAAIVLAHEDDRAVLRRQCPEALPLAVVAGDPSFDRLVASLAWRDHYRHALGITDGQKLILVASTWGREGLFGHMPELLPHIMDQLPGPEYQVATLLHPAVWTAHGGRQVRAWLRDCREAGMILVDPREDWRALAVAADYLIGDHGSSTAYAVAIGRPLLYLPPARPSLITPGSVQELIAAGATRFDPRQPLLPQLAAATPMDRRAVVAALTSRPGLANTLLRQVIYQQLRLAAPGRHRQAAPVPVPGHQRGRRS